AGDAPCLCDVRNHGRAFAAAAALDASRAIAGGCADRLRRAAGLRFLTVAQPDAQPGQTFTFSIAVISRDSLDLDTGHAAKVAVPQNSHGRSSGPGCPADGDRCDAGAAAERDPLRLSGAALR